MKRREAEELGCYDIPRIDKMECEYCTRHLCGICRDEANNSRGEQILSELNGNREMY